MDNIQPEEDSKADDEEITPIPSLQEALKAKSILASYADGNNEDQLGKYVQDFHKMLIIKVIQGTK